MLEKFDKTARRIEEETPPERNRYADFLRVASICLVVLGHWLVAYVTIDDGAVQTARLLALVPETQWLTWLFQVMPVFFFVGGLANAISWTAAQERGESYADWVRRRARRLLWPLVPFFLVTVPLVLLLDAIGVETYLVMLAGQVMLLPLWFLAAYLCVVVAAPGAYWLHRKIGAWAILLFAIGALLIDLTVANEETLLGYVNFFFVWGAIHQLGFFWHDQRIPERASHGLLLAAGALGLLLLLVFLGAYPLTMIGTGVEGEPSNDSPPSLALLILALGQIGTIFALRKSAMVLLQRPRLWALVLLTGSRMMSVYLWHMAAMVLVGLALVPTGLWPLPDRVNLEWWLLRIPWVLILLIALALFVLLFGRFEKAADPEPGRFQGLLGGLKVFASATLAILGLALLVQGGLYTGEGFAGIPWLYLAIFVAGMLGLNVIGAWIFQRNEA